MFSLNLCSSKVFCLRLAIIQLEHWSHVWDKLLSMSMIAHAFASSSAGTPGLSNAGLVLPHLLNCVRAGDVLVIHM